MRSMSPKVLRPEFLQDELEAADRADAGDCGRFRSEGDTARNAEEFWSDVEDDVPGAELWSHLRAVVDGLEWSEDEAGVWRAAAGEREAHDRKGAEDTSFLRTTAETLSANSEV